ncbi:MAG: hypothetical protein EXS00_07475 [Phycisphaerales bacterium]|nr:hypothetical protein [Phycisphaerales bacterium]
MSICLAIAALVAVAPPPVLDSSLEPTPPGAGIMVWQSANEDLARTLAAAGETLTLESFGLSDGSTCTLLLSRTSAMTADAQVVLASLDERGRVSTRPQTIPRVDCFRGVVAGDAASRVFLGAGPCGVHGYVQSNGRIHAISSGTPGAGLPTLVSDLATLPFDASAFACGVDSSDWDEPQDQGGLAGVSPAPCRQSLVAVDTDTEFLMNTFGGNAPAATAYAMLLFTAVREICAADINLRPAISYLRLWDGADPWDQTSMCNQLGQFRDYWNANEPDIERHSAHLINGRALGGGCAWVSAMCTNNGYACSANLGGYFPYPIVDHDGANWDLMVVTHEFGHNLGAPHTHNQAGSPELCGSGDCTNAWAGTIMSYCHQCAGGMTNIAMSFAQVSINSMVAHLGAAACDMTSAGQGVIAIDDSASCPAGSSVEIEVLPNDQFATCDAVSLYSVTPYSAGGGIVAALANGSLRYTAPPAAFQITDTCWYSITNAGGELSSATVTVRVLPITPGLTISGSESGAEANYFELSAPSLLPDFSLLTPYRSDVVGQISFASTGGAFATSGRADNVGAVFSGWVVIPTAGEWKFFVESDDGSSLRLGSTVLVNNDGLHGMVEKSGSTGLGIGFHQLSVAFFEAGGGAGCIARIQGPGMTKQVIPASMLRHGGFPLDIDFNNDGHVDGLDLALLLGTWGSSGPVGDSDGSGLVDALDLSNLLAGWQP